MAVSSRARSSELIQIPSKFKDRDTSPKPKSKNPSDRRVAVVYYLCRDGHLEHPHFMEVPLSSADGLYLKDVINRLSILRGKGMASLYSWSSKRSYKNGFVWHDLAENDFIYPAHGNEYVLKGSELVDLSPNPEKPLLLDAPPSARPANPPGNSDFPAVTRRRNQSWSAIDLNEYKVYKAEPFSESSRQLAADASTQTDDKRRRRRPAKEIEESPEERGGSREEIEISPPPSDSSPETLESLMKADGRLILNPGNGNDDSQNPTAENCGRVKASTVLMQLISCGSMSFRDCGATAVKEQGLSLIGQYKARLPRVGARREGTSKEFTGFSGVRLEDKEYFSGSLIETKKAEIPALKRSNSYNADRSLQVGMGEKEVDGTRTKCIPRKSKGLTLPSKKDNNVSLTSEGSCNTSQAGSKRFDVRVHQHENEAA